MHRTGAVNPGMSASRLTAGLGRNAAVLLHAIKFFSILLVKNVFGRYDAATTGALLRDHLQELGAVYIKLGQALALRYDVFPVRFCEELFKLLDNVEPFDSSTAVAIL